MPPSMNLKLGVFKRDRWICFYCGGPVIFHPSLRLLQEFVEEHDLDGDGYYHRNWAHAFAPLLDYHGAVVDHIRPRAKGGKDTKRNLRTSCNKCNATKNDRDASEQSMRKKVKSKYGRPMKWDGLHKLFVILGTRTPELLTPQEKRWLVAIRESKLS